MGAAAMVPMMNNEKHDHNRHSSQFNAQSRKLSCQLT
jgi:hypothetical protein